MNPPGPIAFIVETRDVHVEALAVEPFDQLDHLPFGSAWVKAGEEDRNRYLWRQLHSGNLSK